jgi:hypothetical protein
MLAAEVVRLLILERLELVVLAVAVLAVFHLGLLELLIQAAAVVEAVGQLALQV